MTMRTKLKTPALLTALLGGALVPSLAAAQVDVRQIRPNVLLLLDTSGSMEWRTGVSNDTCVGVDGGDCNRCTNGQAICPNAADLGSGGAPFVLPTVPTNSCPAIEQKNRWTTAIEVLTGSIENFSCVSRARQDTSSVDVAYPIPYHEPLSNGVPLWHPSARQAADGILDVYKDRVRFGLMTFDNDIDPGTSASPGLFSFGETKVYRPVGCNTNSDVNVGARRGSAGVLDLVPGGMVSVGAPLADGTALDAINTAIQQSLIGRYDATTPQLAVRPYGATPIAAMLEDAEHYWRSSTDVAQGVGGDPYFECRARFNILVTDGAPNLDFRPACRSTASGSGSCPYDLPEDTTLRMAYRAGASPGVQTYVVAFNASDRSAADALEPIAIAGGTSNVLYASSGADLRGALSRVLDSIASQTSTRTAPAFGSAGSGGGGGLNGAQYQFQSSFAVAAGYPWEGVLERRRTICTGSPVAPVDQDLDAAQDDFGYLLRASVRAARGWGTRRLWSWWSGTSVTSFTALQATLAPTSMDPTRKPLDSTTPRQVFNASTTGERDSVLAWLRGDAGTARETRPLGDIYHSNPLIVPPPGVSIPDQTFSAFRQKALSIGGWRTVARTVGTRETMVYVGTNDGLLHAFDADTGQEHWAFMPPFLGNSVRTMVPANHLYGVDGSPVMRDVVFRRTASALGNADSWHTVLVTGLRGGGGAYFALDVTDPLDPKFLWQYTDSTMASAFGTPALGTIYTDWDLSSNHERAVAILPGGTGTPDAACLGGTGLRPTRTDTRISNELPLGTPRSNVRCWTGTTGQYLHVVDLETGRLIRKLGPTASPIVGSPALYIGTTGSVSTRAYVGDADGGVWRLDMSDPTPSNWKFSLLYDVFSNATASAGQPITSQPVISVDRDGSTLVAVGTGDPDLLEGYDANRVVVFREELAFASDGAVNNIRVGNVWQLDSLGSDLSRGLDRGERLTGPMTLYNGSLYFGTFVPANSTDACRMGYSRMWGVSLSEATNRIPEPMLDQDGDPSTTLDITRVTRDINGNGSSVDDENSVLFGVGVLRNQSCVSLSSGTDPFTSLARSWVEDVSGGDFRLVAQVGRSAGTVGGNFRTTVVSRRLASPVVEPRIEAWAVVFE